MFYRQCATFWGVLTLLIAMSSPAFAWLDVVTGEVVSVSRLDWPGRRATAGKGGEAIVRVKTSTRLTLDGKRIEIDATSQRGKADQPRSSMDRRPGASAAQNESRPARVEPMQSKLRRQYRLAGERWLPAATRRRADQLDGARPVAVLSESAYIDCFRILVSPAASGISFVDRIATTFRLRLAC